MTQRKYSLRIPEDLYEKIKERAYGANASVNQMIVWALEDAFRPTTNMVVTFTESTGMTIYPNNNMGSNVNYTSGTP